MDLGVAISTDRDLKFESVNLGRSIFYPHRARGEGSDVATAKAHGMRVSI
jgi:hypothetical protein